LSARLCYAVLIVAGTFVVPQTVSADEAAVAIRNDHIHLSIVEQRIDRGPYESSLQVGIARPVQVHVGVALTTAHIAVTLRGVRGDGEFHGDLSRLTRVIAAHHVAP